MSNVVEEKCIEVPYKELRRIEFYELSREKINIGLLMMVKNEKKRLQVTLDSLIDQKTNTKFVDCMIVFDTGSTDNTIEIFENHSRKYEMNLYLIQGEFVNYSISRNVSLDYADTIDNVNLLLLLDCNDELRGGVTLRENSHHLMKIPNTVFLVNQEWFSGSYDKYYNTRLVKPRNGWRYKGSVHEYLANDTLDAFGNKKNETMIRIDNKITLYQDRTQDDDKSSKRYKRDRELLLTELQENPKHGRTLFYLAQTCSCLGNVEESLMYYTQRTEVDDFLEEKFHAFLRGGLLKQQLKHSWDETLSWFMKAFEVLPRAEPLCHIAEYYRLHDKWLLSYMFAKQACDLEFPKTAILFVEKHVYDYKRWHILGIVGWYAEKYDEGKQACLKAIACGLNNALDTSNLRFYEERESKLIASGEMSSNTITPTIETKDKFLARNINELASKFPGLNKKQLDAKASFLWKNRHKLHKS